jgi:lipoyl-dependent peroxiredoxin
MALRGRPVHQPERGGDLNGGDASAYHRHRAGPPLRATRADFRSVDKGFIGNRASGDEGRIYMKTYGQAVWQGGIKDGKGAISTPSGALKDYPYGFSSRFEGKPGTNPEELIGAAHAGCFTMALSLILGEAKLTAEHMETKAEVTLDKVADGFAITAVHLTLRAKVPGATQATFQELAGKAKIGCPVSKLLKADISLDATLIT